MGLPFDVIVKQKKAANKMINLIIRFVCVRVTELEIAYIFFRQIIL